MGCTPDSNWIHHYRLTPHKRARRMCNDLAHTRVGHRNYVCRPAAFDPVDMSTLRSRSPNTRQCKSANIQRGLLHMYGFESFSNLALTRPQCP